MKYIDKRDGRIIDIPDGDLNYILASDRKHLQKYETAFKGDSPSVKTIQNENKNNKGGDRRSSERDSRKTVKKGASNTN